MIKVAFIIALTIMGISGCNLQKRLLYYPGSSAPSPETLKAEQLRYWRASSGDYRGLVSDTEIPAAKGTIVVFHGNGGIAADRGFYIKGLGPLGYRLILAEYPGYGGRKGEVGEAEFVEDAMETVRLAREEFGSPLYLLGESLGCGVTASLTSRMSEGIDGIVLITPWDTLEAIASVRLPFLPARLFLSDSYDNIGNLHSFKGRITVVGAEMDEVVPIGHARKLFESLPSGSARMWTISGAGHNDWPYRINDDWWREIMGYVAGGGR